MTRPTAWPTPSCCPPVMEYNAPATGRRVPRHRQGHGRGGRGRHDPGRVPQGRHRRREAAARQDVGIPADLKGIVKDEDVHFLVRVRLCRRLPSRATPRDTSVEEIAALYRSADVSGGFPSVKSKKGQAPALCRGLGPIKTLIGRQRPRTALRWFAGKVLRHKGLGALPL